MSQPYSSRRLRRRSSGYTREEAALVNGDTGWSTTMLVVWKKPCALISESKKMFPAMNTRAGHSTSLRSRFPCEQRQERRSATSSVDSRGPDSEVCVTHWTWKLQHMILLQYKIVHVLVSTWDLRVTKSSSYLCLSMSSFILSATFVTPSTCPRSWWLAASLPFLSFSCFHTDCR